MSSFAMRLAIVAACALCNLEVLADMRLRETLLQEARIRIQSWYTDPSLIEPSKTRSGVAVSMMKQDRQCGGDLVPVTFAEFDVVGARPVDVFNTALDTAAQKQWNPQCTSAAPLGEWPELGTRAWAVAFDIPLLSKREFLQWQAADANFAKEEFWLAFSTQNNEKLHEKITFQEGAVESQNCLGAFHITKLENGAHVVITQQVNVHPLFTTPLHQIMDFFPPAWQGTVNFVQRLSNAARQRALASADIDKTVAPPFMLQDAPSSSPRSDGWLPSAPGKEVVYREDFPKIEAKSANQARLSPVQCLALVLLVPACIILISSMAFGTGRFVAQKLQAFRGQEVAAQNGASPSPDLENEASAVE